jgi:hypothetical protein
MSTVGRIGIDLEMYIFGGCLMSERRVNSLS